LFLFVLLLNLIHKKGNKTRVNIIKRYLHTFTRDYDVSIAFAAILLAHKTIMLSELHSYCALRNYMT